MPGVQFREWQQLQLECIPVMQEYRAVIVVDAAVHGETIALVPVVPQPSSEISASHHLSALTLVSLADQLHLPLPPVWLCSIPAERFDFGGQLSLRAEEHGRLAKEEILEWLRNLPD